MTFEQGQLVIEYLRTITVLLGILVGLSAVRAFR